MSTLAETLKSNLNNPVSSVEFDLYAALDEVLGGVGRIWTLHLVHAEDLDKRKRVLTGTAFVTVVALNDEGKPTEVPPLNLATDKDKQRFREGESRMINRPKHACKMSTTTD